MSRTGRCLCDATRFRVEGEAHSVGHCYCRMCQQSSGALAVTWATFPIECVSLEGELRWYESSPRARRAFCKRCGASIAWQKLEAPRFIDLTVALFDDPQQLPPTYAIHARSKPEWLRLDEHLPHHAEGQALEPE